VRLPGLPWSPEFMAAYERALGQSKQSAGKRGSILEAIDGYIDFEPFAAHGLAPVTLTRRRQILKAWIRDHGHKPVASVTTDDLTRSLAAMPQRGAAENLLKAIRGLMKWCVQQGLIESDPSLAVKIKRRKTGGHHTWTEDEIARFEAHHAIGGKPRLAFALLLYTAQRRGDVIRMGRQHIRDGVLHVEQQKTGAKLAIPIHPHLREILEATPSEHLTFITNMRGKPFNPTAFSDWFRVQCDLAGLPKACNAHGLRKAACRRLAEAGCSVHQIASISGHATLAEIERYTKAADQARLARSAINAMVPGVKISRLDSSG
jgi:integrase